MIHTRLYVYQMEMKGALSASEKRFTVNDRRDRDGEASTKLPSFGAVGLVEAARTWGGQLCVRSRAKLSRTPWCSPGSRPHPPRQVTTCTGPRLPADRTRR